MAAGERTVTKQGIVMPVPPEEEREGAGITIEVLQQHFHQPLVTVADELGVSLTMIKRLCRKLGMPRWPYRQIDSINKSMEDLRDQLEGARTEADRARFRKLLEDAMKKKKLITRGAAAGVDPNVRNALYLADTANVSEDDIFGNPDLMPKLSAALKTITKRKRVKGKPLVELIATVRRDGSLPACVQTSGGSLATGPSSLGRSASVGSVAARAPAVRRQHRPPALVDAIATSNEEYAANLAHAYGNINRPESSASAATSVSPAMSSLGNGNTSVSGVLSEDWGHSNGYDSQRQQQQPWSRQGTPSSAHHGVLSGGPFSNSHHGHEYLLTQQQQETVGDSPTSSCTTLVAGTSPGGGDGRFSPGFSPVTKSLSPATAELTQRRNRINRAQAQYAAMAGHMSGGVGMIPEGAQSAPASRTSGHPSARGSHWGRVHQTPARRKPQKRLSTTSSLASTDVESLDTSHLLEFDDDDDDEPPYGSQGYVAGELGGPGDGFGGAQRARGSVDGKGSAGGAGASESEHYGVSPEDLQELEDALLMDTFGGVMDELLEGEDIAGPFPDLQNQPNSFPDLHNVAASLPPLPRGHSQNAGQQRGTPRSSVSGAAGSPHQSLSQQQVLGGASPSHAASASPIGGSAGATGFPLPGSSNGPPRPGPRGMGRPRNQQVPPRPYTPSKSARGGGSTPWLSHGIGGGISPRVGSSPRPPTPRTPGGSRMSGHTQQQQRGGSGAQPGPSPKNRRRGEEAFPEFGLVSPNEHGANGRGAPSPKARRVGARAFPERFPGSPLAGAGGLSPRLRYPPQSPRSSSGGAASPLDGNSRTYFPAPAAANGSSKSHHCSSSNNWCPAPMHGGVGDGGVDATAAATALTKSQNWSVMLGDPKASSLSSSRQGWGASAGADGQGVTPSPSSRRTSTGLTNGAAPDSGGHGVLNLPTPKAEVGSSRWTGRTTSSISSSTSTSSSGSIGERTSQPTNWTAHGQHHVLQRRHSAPVAAPIPLQTTGIGAGAEWVGEAPPGSTAQAMGMVKEEGASLDDHAHDEFVNHSHGDAAQIASAWAPPAPPPSPMPDKYGGAAGGDSCLGSLEDQDNAWWAPLGHMNNDNGVEQQSHGAVEQYESTEFGEGDVKPVLNSGRTMIMGL